MHRATPIVSWLHEQGLKGVDGGKILEGLCDRLWDTGIEIERAVVGFLIFHPQFDAMNFTWTHEGRTAERFAVTMRDILNGPSPFLHMQSTGLREMRHRLEGTETQLPYASLNRIRELGFTDYFAFFEQFGTHTDHTIWPELPVDMKLHEGVTGSFSTVRTGGFTEDDLALLRILTAPIAVAVRVSFVLEMAETLLGAYLGNISGRSVLRGQVRRGQGRIIHAVVWHSDLRDSTHLAETEPLEAYLATLNRYYDCIVGAVMDHGGEVLKFIGDGVLAIFPFEAGTHAEAEVSKRALWAAQNALDRLKKANDERSMAGIDEIRCGIALHSGDLMYGNVGSEHRLDFTVMGPTVNEVVRLESLCKRLNEPLVLSESVATLLDEKLSFLGEYELPGIGHSIKVFSPTKSVIDKT